MELPTNISSPVNTSQKATIIFTTFGIFGVMLASFFIFNLTEISKRKSNSTNLIVNSNFEKWSKSILIGWKNRGANLILEKKDATNKYLVRICSEKSDPQGIYQTVSLNPTEIYSIRYRLKSNIYQFQSAGVEIKYEGDEVRATSDAISGIHYHESGNQWRQYFGRVTGAKSLTLFFFAKNNTCAYLDAIAVGTNVEPFNTITEVVSPFQ